MGDEPRATEQDVRDAAVKGQRDARRSLWISSVTGVLALALSVATFLGTAHSQHWWPFTQDQATVDAKQVEVIENDQYTFKPRVPSVTHTVTAVNNSRAPLRRPDLYLVYPNNPNLPILSWQMQDIPACTMETFVIAETIRSLAGDFQVWALDFNVDDVEWLTTDKFGKTLKGNFLVENPRIRSRIHSPDLTRWSDPKITTQASSGCG